MKLLTVSPGLPVKNLDRSLGFYQNQLGFVVDVRTPTFAQLRLDGVELYLWVADDESWRTQRRSAPVVSGAESFIAGTSSCRIRIDGVDELCRGAQTAGLARSSAGVDPTAWGTRELHLVDPDGNLLTFFEPA